MYYTSSASICFRPTGKQSENERTLNFLESIAAAINNNVVVSRAHYYVMQRGASV